MVVLATLTGDRCCEQRRLRKWTAGLWCGVWVSTATVRHTHATAERLTQTVAAISAENNCPCGLHNSYEDLLDEEDDTGIVEQLRANGLVQEAFGTNKCCARLTPQPAQIDGCCGQVVGTSVLQPTSARPKPRSKAPHRKSDNTRARSFVRLG